MPPWRIICALLPEILLTFFGIVVMMLEAVSKGKRTYLGDYFSVWIAAAFAANVPGLIAEPGAAFHDMVVIEATVFSFAAL